MAYDINSFYALGALDSLVDVDNADSPTLEDIDKVSLELEKAISARDYTLNHRLKTIPATLGGRISSNKVREKIAEQWN